jgi:hypothetical protein
MSFKQMTKRGALGTNGEIIQREKPFLLPFVLQSRNPSCMQNTRHCCPIFKFPADC